MPTRYWRLSSFYFFYFASLGALIPYWTLYLKDLGFSALEIGELIATLAISKIIAPYLWGWLADRTGFHIRIVKITTLLSILCFLPLLWVDEYWLILLSMMLFSFFWNAALPQFEVVTLSQLGDEKSRYSQIRLWGSLGFIATVVVLGLIFEVVAISRLPIILLGIFGTIWLASLSVSEVSAPTPAGAGIGSVLKRPEVIALLLCSFLMQASHGPYYTFYTLYMDGYGYSPSVIGMLWSLGVVAEIVIFLLMPRLSAHFSRQGMFSAALALTAIRWVLVALFADSIPVVIVAQCLHAASFGLFHVCAIHLIDHYFSGHQGRGQALYALLSFGVGGAVGSLYSGYLWELASPELTYLVAVLFALAGFLVSLKLRGPTTK